MICAYCGDEWTWQEGRTTNQCTKCYHLGRRVWIEKDGWPVEFVEGASRILRSMFRFLAGARYRHPTEKELKDWYWI